jgi:hypothetical protein
MDQRTALVLTGLPRDFELASRYIKSQICEPLNIGPRDIFISVWDDVGYWHPGDSKSARSFYPSGRVSREAIEKVYPGATIQMESFKFMEGELQRRVNGLPEVYFPSISHSNFLARGINIVSMFYKIQNGLELVPKGQYDRIVRTRPDIALDKRLKPRSESRFQILRQRNHMGNGLGDNLHIGSEAQQAAIRDVYGSLDDLFVLQRGLVCPHLFVESALRLHAIPIRELRAKYTTLHTPGGQYHAQNRDGSWVKAADADYSRSDKEFQGKTVPR